MLNKYVFNEKNWFLINPRGYLTDSKIKSYKILIPLSILLGIRYISYVAAIMHVGDKLRLGTVIFLIFAMGPFWGFIYEGLAGYMCNLIGNQLGNKANLKVSITAFAWSNIPNILVLILALLEVLLTGNGHFMKSSNIALNVPMYILIILGVIEIILKLWTFILWAICTSEIHGLSIYKSLLTCLGTYLMIYAFTFFTYICMLTMGYLFHMS